MFTPGEAAAAAYTGYLTERTLTGMIAAAVGGAVILIERKHFIHRIPSRRCELT